MLRTDFSFDLPESLIAQAPLERRDASRLLCLASAESEASDRQFSGLYDLLRPGDLLVMNDTRVIPARLFGHKQTGGRVEILLERVLDDHRCLAQIRSSKSPKPASFIELDEGYRLQVLSRQDALFELSLSGDGSLLQMFERIGHIPLPPYIQRADTEADQERYQTVYAENPGAVAAPTAGLHFDQAMLDRLQQKGIELEKVTLHVGAGTFQPVRADHIEDHVLHEETLEVSESVVSAVHAAKARGNRVVAVGTTSVRALESAASGGELRPMQGDTQIYIYPGYNFRVIDALLTNFHLPESSLLMLVCALGGYDRVMAAYRHAVEQQYRFFSYGDAMFVEPLEPGQGSNGGG